MGGGELIHIVPFSVGGFVAVKPRTVPGGHALFHKANGIAWKAIDGRRDAGTAVREDRGDQCHGERRQASSPIGRPRRHELKLVERFVAKDGLRLFRVRDSEHDDRALPFSGGCTVSALHIDPALGQKIRDLL